MNKTPQQTADEIFNEYYSWVRVISYTVESEKILKVLAVELSLISVNTTINSHNTKDEIIFWSKVKNLLKGKLLNSNK